MPTRPPDSGVAPVSPEAGGTAGPRRVTVTADGPVLIEGPVEIALPDGGVVRSDRFVVALCACRRSRRYPFCDTSHRRRVRTAAVGGSGGAAEADGHDDPRRRAER